MAVMKIRNDADDAWITLGGGVSVVQQAGAPATTYPGMLWVDTDADNPGNSIIEDDDNDTKIQCEESADEDIIRFDVGGTELFQMTTAGELISHGHANSAVRIQSSTAVNESVLRFYDSVGPRTSLQQHGSSHATLASILGLYHYGVTGFVQNWYPDGEVTKPVNPGFQAFKNADSAVVTDSYVTIAPWTAEWQIGTNFNITTGVFTAPVDGRYLFSCVLTLKEVDIDVDYFAFLWLHGGGTSSSYSLVHCDEDEVNYNYAHYSNTIVIEMDASDTLQLQWKRNAAGANEAKVFGTYSTISGYLLG